jgi:type IV fimbrial biogenesis protein FimT
MDGRPAARQRGFTLLEVAIVLAVLGILLAIGVPSYANLLARQQLRAAGEQLALELRHARESSVRGEALYASFRGGPDWCWGISRGQPCDCASGVPACNVSVGRAAEYPRVLMERASEPLSFEPGAGRLLAAGETAFATRAGHSLQVRSSLLGRTQLCGPDAPKPTNC